jgi:hypothetical protein
MSRRDTIIIAVLINACLLVILFATSITKKEEKGFGSNYSAPATSSAPSIQFSDVERSLVKETRPIEESYPLQSPLALKSPIEVQEKKMPQQEKKMPQQEKKIAPEVKKQVAPETRYLP